MYRVIILPKALADLSSLDKAVAQRISDKLTWLSEIIKRTTPIPLKGEFSGFYKLKAGDWRVIYEVDHSEKTVTVHKVGHRREIYK